MPITIKDIALQAGVSASTVSRVISKSPRISKETTEKVNKIMEDLGYHPNIMAKSLVSKTTNTLGVILPRPAEELFLNLFFPEIIRGIITHTSRTGYDFLMATGISEADQLESLTRLVKGRRVDGIILLQSRRNDPLIEFLLNESYPFALIGRSEYDDVLSIDNDNVQAAYDAARHLIAQGHERIGFVSGPRHLTVSLDRLEGYTKALNETGLRTNEDWIVEEEFLQESGYRAMSIFMGMPERPTALVVMDDMIAFGILRSLSELNFRVPGDLSVISFNNIPLTELSTPPISSVDIGIYQLGYTASQSLIRLIHDDSQSRQRIIIPHRLMIRESSLNVNYKRS